MKYNDLIRSQLCVYHDSRAVVARERLWPARIIKIMIATKEILTHCGRVTHICVNKLTIIGSDNGLSPGRRQAIIGTNVEILLIGPLGTNFSEILIEICAFSLKKIRLKMSSAKCCSFRLGLNVLIALVSTNSNNAPITIGPIRSQMSGTHFTNMI